MMTAFVFFLSAGIIFGLASADDDLVFIKAWPATTSDRAIYQMPLSVNGSNPTTADKIVQQSDDISSGGFTYNYKTKSVIWGFGTEVKSLSVDYNNITTLADISDSIDNLYSINDFGVDGLGNIYFAADEAGTKGLIGKIDSSGTVTEMHKETSNYVINAIAVDPIGMSIFGAVPISPSQTKIKRFDGSTMTEILTATSAITSIAVDIHEQNVYYSDGVKIYYTNYTTPNGQNEFYDDTTFASDITDLDVAGDYVYYVGSSNQNVIRLNKHVASDRTSIGPNIEGISRVDVVLASESVILCDTTGVPHATVSADCVSPMAGVSCDYTCNYGYEKNPPTASLTCGDNNGVWDLSTPCRAMDEFILVRQQGNLASQRDVFMIPLNKSGTSQAIKVADLEDGANSGGIIFDGSRRSVIYSVGGIINSASIDDDTQSILADLSSGEFFFNIVADMALDTTTGDIYFAGYSRTWHGSPQRKGTIGVIDTDGIVTTVYITTDVFADMAIDPVNRFLFAVSGSPTYKIMKMDFNGSNEVIVKASAPQLLCIAVDVADQTLLWSDNYLKIYKMGYDGSNEDVFYEAPTGKSPRDMKVVGDYIYYVGGGISITKVHRLDASNVTDFEPTNGQPMMFYLDVPTVFGSPAITSCGEDDLGNTTLPANCTGLGVKCSMTDVKCGYGFKKNATIVYLVCSLSGFWNVQLSTVCNEIICSSGDIDHTTGTCTAKVGETCDALTCSHGYQLNPNATSLNCTESGVWNYNRSSVCLETFCDLAIPNGNFSSTCGNRVDDTCDNFTCGYGYSKTDQVESLNCTGTGEWSYNVSLLCLETVCNRSIPQGRLSDTCDIKVDDSCSNFSCDYGFHKKTGVEPMNCTAQGTWDYDISTLCIETLCERSIPNGNLSDLCGVKVGDTCDNFTCAYGFEVAESVASFNCSEAGLWTTDVSALCIETYCPVAFELGEVSNATCGFKVGETCTNFTCSYGYRKVDTFPPFNCTESGEWSYNLSSLCTEILCPIDITHGNLSDSCGRNVGDSCNIFTCNYGYHEATGVEPFNCTETGTWNYDVATLCIETVCDRQVPNGNLDGACGIQVDDSCDNFTCDFGYNKTEGVGIFNCTEDGNWDYNVSLLCNEIFCNYDDLVNAAFGDCTRKVGDVCNNFTCNHGFEKNPAIVSLTCTESGQWNYNLSTLCVETVCLNDVPNGALDAACIDSKVDQSCDNFTCNSGFIRKTNVGQFNCTADGTWDVDLATLCSVSCPDTVSNGALANHCSTNVGATCENITCNQGFTRNDDIVSLVCKEDGTWALNITFQCNSTMTSAINCEITPPADTTISGWIVALGSTCNYEICNNDYQQVSNTDSVVCMSNINWEIYDVVRCSASDCSRGHSFKEALRDGLNIWTVMSLGLVLRSFIY